MSRNLIYIPSFDSDDSSSGSDDEMEQQNLQIQPYSQPYHQSAPAAHQVSERGYRMAESGHNVEEAIILSDDDKVEACPSAPQSKSAMSRSEVDGQDELDVTRSVRDSAYASDPGSAFQVSRGETEDQQMGNSSQQNEDNHLDFDDHQHYESDLPPSYTSSIEHDLQAQITTLRQHISTQTATLKQKDAHIQSLTANSEQGNKIIGHQSRQIYDLQNELGWAKTRAKRAEAAVRAASLAVSTNAGRNWPEFGRRMDELAKAVRAAEAD